MRNKSRRRKQIKLKKVKIKKQIKLKKVKIKKQIKLKKVKIKKQIKLKIDQTGNRSGEKRAEMKGKSKQRPGSMEEKRSANLSRLVAKTPGDLPAFPFLLDFSVYSTDQATKKQKFPSGAIQKRI